MIDGGQVRLGIAGSLGRNLARAFGVAAAQTKARPATRLAGAGRSQVRSSESCPGSEAPDGPNPAFRVAGLETTVVAEVGVWVPWHTVRKPRR